ncbi:MAG: ABC-three component system middle component 2 [Xanthobacteraceae bacterium]
MSASPFNTPLETGIRLLILLGAAYPQSLSLDRLVMLDHVLVHTGDFDGPASVHPASPYRVAEPYVR